MVRFAATRETPALRLPRAVLFDWDNTLVDSWGTIHESMNETLLAMGHRSWTPDETRRRVRRSLREAFPELFGARWEEARELFYRRFRAIHLDRLAARPGAETLIRALAARNVYLGVVSNKGGEHLRREAQHLGWDRWFARLVGATDAGRDKPAPDPVELALAGSGIAAGRDVWFCGDTWIDMKCARDTGCVAILLDEEGEEGCDPDPALRSFAPDHRFRDCRQLLSLVMRL